jgi:hypothetical protein
MSHAQSRDRDAARPDRTVAPTLCDASPRPLEPDAPAGSFPALPPALPSANGLILYRGPSLLDRGPIAAIVTGLWRPSANRKTGAMLQTWILRDDTTPLDAVRTGSDASVCGHCPLRASPRRGRRCYVNLGQAPLTVYDALARGAYPQAEGPAQIAAAGYGRSVRLGSYGDPAAVPTAIWFALVSRASRWTGYTHQWDSAGFDDRLLDLCMASVERMQDVQWLALRHPGARYFRVRPPGTAAAPSEAQCPAASEAGRRLRCEACGACNGRAGTGPSISTNAHGALALRAWTRHGRP